MVAGTAEALAVSCWKAVTACEATQQHHEHQRTSSATRRSAWHARGMTRRPHREEKRSGSVAVGKGLGLLQNQHAQKIRLRQPKRFELCLPISPDATYSSCAGGSSNPRLAYHSPHSRSHKPGLTRSAANCLL